MQNVFHGYRQFANCRYSNNQIQLIVSILYFFKMIYAAQKLEKFCKNDFVIKLCIVIPINNEQVVLFIIVYLG